VREAMAALLAAVQRTRAIHFYDVVPLEGLLAVMACDAPSVSHKIQQVLVPTYFPNPKEGSVSAVPPPFQRNGCMVPVLLTLPHL